MEITWESKTQQVSILFSFWTFAEQWPISAISNFCYLTWIIFSPLFCCQQLLCTCYIVMTKSCVSCFTTCFNIKSLLPSKPNSALLFSSTYPSQKRKIKARKTCDSKLICWNLTWCCEASYSVHPTPTPKYPHHFSKNTIVYFLDSTPNVDSISLSTDAARHDDVLQILPFVIRRSCIRRLLLYFIFVWSPSAWAW